MWRVPNSARMLLPADAQPQLRPTPLEEREKGGVSRDEGMVGAEEERVLGIEGERD